MSQKIKFILPDRFKWSKYKIISTDGRLLYKGSKSTVKLKARTMYQVLVDNDMTTIFTVHSSVHSNTKVAINPHTTIATIFCFSQLLDADIRIHAKRCNNQYITRLSVAKEIMSNFINMRGDISATLKKGPNGLETNSWRLFNFLANILLACLYDKRIACALNNITGQSNILKSFHYIASNPFKNISEIYALGCGVEQRYFPSICSIEQIGQFTLSLKVNTSGALNYLPGGPAAISIDKYQNVWISLNTVQGTDGSNTWAMVLGKDAKPKSFSPVFPILGAAYGNAYDKYRDVVILGSFGWGSNNIAYNPFEGSISIFNAKNGRTLTPPNGYTDDLHRVQGIAVDLKGNYWICSWGSNDPLGSINGFSRSSNVTMNEYNSSIVCYLDGNPQKKLVYEIDIDENGPSPNYGPFAILVDSNNNIFVSIGGSDQNGKIINSAIIKLSLNRKMNRIILLAQSVATSFYFYKGIAVDSNDNVFVASFKEDKILMFDNYLNPITDYYEAQSGPWGVYVDNRDNIWVANFLKENDISSGFHVTKLKQYKLKQYKLKQYKLKQYKLKQYNSQLRQVGKFTLPSGGEPVTLATGRVITDLKGPIYSPLMRQTYNLADAAGNLYVANNWKPSLFTDLFNNGDADPGGDGVVIFIGCAAPRNLT